MTAATIVASGLLLRERPQLSHQCGVTIDGATHFVAVHDGEIYGVQLNCAWYDAQRALSADLLEALRAGYEGMQE